MFFQKNLIGCQENIELFNGLGDFEDLEGNLLEGNLKVYLKINHTPKIHWEFQATKGEYSFNSPSIDPRRLTSSHNSSYHLIVENPKCTSRGGVLLESHGYAERVLYGDINADAHYFDAYIPNTDFLRDAIGNDLSDLQKIIKKHLGKEKFTAELDNVWSIELFTSQEVLDWLKPQIKPPNQNTGSMITVKIRLFQTEQNLKETQDLAVMSLNEAQQIFSELCWMLSYMNGGYIQPVYISAHKFTENSNNPRTVQNVSSLAQAPFLIYPIEDIGIGFIGKLGYLNLLDFLQCFSCFHRMLKSEHWRDEWIVILQWYFQSIPRISGRRKNVLLPVIANALGALLEKLAFLILVKDSRVMSKTKFKNTILVGRIPAIHKHIGIAEEIDLVEDFVKIRNNATHAQSKHISLNQEEQLTLILKVIQWVDEIILWRLGYKRNYIYRYEMCVYGTLPPRYDLSRRKPDWSIEQKINSPF